MNKAKKKIAIIDLIVLVVLAIVLGITMVWSRDIELKLGLLYYVDAEGVAEEDIVTLNSVYASADGSAELKVHFVDVGQGDCILIQLPDGKNMIIDAGSGTSSSGPTAVKNSVKSYINNTLGDGFKYFDYAILTHPDSDHCNVLDDVLNMYPSRVCYRPNVDATVTGYTDQGKADLTSDARKKNTAVYTDAIKAMYHVSDDMTSVVYVTDPAVNEQSFTGGNGNSAYTFTFYSPLTKKYGSDDWNNYSPIMILDYQGYKFALSGDAEEKNLGEFVAKVNSAKTDGVTDKYDAFDDDYCVNVIKAGHHGSENATTPDYLSVLTTPSGAENVYCVVSVGTGNTYGHPHDAALNRYKEIGLPEENILRTDQKGDISFTVRADEDGAYAMYCGDKKTQNPNAPIVDPDPNPDPDPDPTPDPDPDPDPEPEPEPDPEPEPEPEPEKKQVLVYRELGGIKLKWAVVAWSCYAVVVVFAAAHIALGGRVITVEIADGKGKGKKGGKRKR